MRLEKYEDKSKKKRKAMLISIGVIVLISVSFLLYETFASFTESAEFTMMKGKVDYFGNSDIYFVFYKGDELLEKMPQKDNEEGLVFERGSCDNGASIEWNIDEWAPLIKGLNSPKTKCSLYFVKDTKAIRKISTSDNNGMWGYKNKLTKIVIEDAKSVKEAPEGGKVYGPFDESEYKSKAVESYVVCEENDTNCIGYLQSDGKVIANPDSNNLFYSFSNVKLLEYLNNLDTSNVIYMQSMFSGMASLISLDLTGLNTSQVTDMSNMFGGLKLQSLDISQLDTSKVTEMDAMFMSCSNLNEINGLDSLVTSNLRNMDQMFQGCSNIATLDLSHFNTKSVNNISGIFSGMRNLKILNLSNWIFTDITCESFANKTSLWDDSNLEKIILDNVNTSDVTNMSGMFSGLTGCKNLTTLDLSDFDTSKVVYMKTMFAGSAYLQEIKLNGLVTKNLTNMSNMFSSCSGLKSLDLSSFDTSHVTDMSNLFFGTSSLQKVDISSFDTSNVTNFNYMFAGSYGLKSIIFGPKFIHKNGATTNGMFGGCPTQDRPTDSSWQGVSFD